MQIINAHLQMFAYAFGLVTREDNWDLILKSVPA